MKIVIIGSGYVGLVSGVCLAAKGHDIICVDTNIDIVNSLNKSQATIYEKGLQNHLNDVIKKNKFKASSDLKLSLEDAEAVIIAVGTPSKDGIINLNFVSQVAKEIGEYIKVSPKYLSVIVKSTVVPGTTDTLIKNKIELHSGKKIGDFGLGMNPEFLREGEAIDDFMDPDRIVFGFEDEKTLNILHEIYSPWDADKIEMNTRSAELLKYANNILLATQISIINEITNLSNVVGKIDMRKVVSGISLDKRWNPKVNGNRINPKILEYLIPGCGFGGSCFPKDIQAIRAFSKSFMNDMEILDAILKVNREQPHQVVKILERNCTLAGKNVLLLGLSFKPNTDDVRESSSLVIAKDLIKKNVNLKIHDPVATDNFIKYSDINFENIISCDSWESEINWAEVIIVATSWEEYKKLKIINLEGKIIFDARYLFNNHDFKNAKYLTISN